MSIRFAVIGVSRDRRSDYLRACGEALEHLQRLRRAQIPDIPQPKIRPRESLEAA